MFHSYNLYHLTDLGNLESIFKNGLDPKFARNAKWREKAVYLAGDLNHAQGYKNHHGDWKNQGIALHIISSDLNQDSLIPDDCDLVDILDQNDDFRSWKDIEWLESLELCGQCSYKKVIPSCIISIIVDNEFVKLKDYIQSHNSSELRF